MMFIAAVFILSFSLVLSQCSVGSQLKSGVTSYTSDTDCASCPMGYHTGGGADVCTACVEGRYKDTTGGTTADTCKGKIPRHRTFVENITVIYF